MKVLMYDENDYPIFEIEIEDNGQYKETSFNAVVREVISWSPDDSKTPYEYEDYLDCYIKWDSCSHFNFGELLGENKGRDSYLHLCGVAYYKNHCNLLKFLYELAFKQMGREPLEGETW